MSQNNQKTDTFKSILQVEIYSVLKNLYPEKANSIIQKDIDVTHPKEENHGDYSSSICLKISKILGLKPIEIAQKIQGELSINMGKLKNLGVEKVAVETPGFLNFWLSREFFITQLEGVLDSPLDYGKNLVSVKNLEKGLKKQSENIKLGQSTEKGTVLIEFADPNPFKEFHIGHLRNITLGESFSRLFENFGYQVKRVNYQGDVGSHVAKAIWGLRKLNSTSWDVKTVAQAYVVGTKAYEEDKLAKKQILEINLGIYKKNRELLDEWNRGRKVSLDAFEEVYKRVGTTYERYYFESEIADNGVEIVKKHLADGVFKESDGAVIYDGEKIGLHKRVFVTKEGYATYEAKDLALAVLKYEEFKYDLSVIITAHEQTEYFKVMLSALSQFRPDLAQKTLHIPFGMVNLKAEKMSSRTGKVITANWLLDEAKKKAASILEGSKENYSEKEVEEITEKVALAAVKYAMLKFASKSDILFDFDESVSLEGDSGPYLLYTYARCRSVLRKSKKQAIVPSLNRGKARSKKQENLNINDEELALLRTFYKFSEVAYEAGVNFAPNLICSYLFDLAQKYNLFYTKHSILNPKEKNEEVKKFRLALTLSTATVLKNGLYLLGIGVLERM